MIVRYNFQAYKKLFLIGPVIEGVEALYSLIKEKIDALETNVKEEDNSAYSTRFKIKNETDDLHDSVIIVLGNSLTFSVSNKQLSYLNDFLSRINSQLLFVRGQNDNKVLFNDERIKMSNINAAQDYSIIQIDKRNILVIGGNISVDRSWKKTQEKIIKKQMYWYDENTEYNGDLLHEILSTIKIDAIASVTCPTFVSTPPKNIIKEWVTSDNCLEKDYLAQRLTMDEIYKTVISTDCDNLRFWAYGESQFNEEIVCNNILFEGMSQKTINSDKLFSKNIRQDDDFISSFIFEEPN